MTRRLAARRWRNTLTDVSAFTDVAGGTAHGGARARRACRCSIFLIVFAGLMYFTKKKVWKEAEAPTEAAGGSGAGGRQAPKSGWRMVVGLESSPLGHALDRTADERRCQSTRPRGSSDPMGTDASRSSGRTARSASGYLAKAGARQCARRRRDPGMVGPAGPDQGHLRPLRAGRLRCAGARSLHGHGGALSRHRCGRAAR